MKPPQVIGRARVAASFPHTKTVPLPGGRWFPMVERNPEALRRLPLDGYVWVDIDGQLRHIIAAFLEIEVEG
jgi:hypothetical protein